MNKKNKFTEMGQKFVDAAYVVAHPVKALKMYRELKRSPNSEDRLTARLARAGVGYFVIGAAATVASVAEAIGMRTTGVPVSEALTFASLTMIPGSIGLGGAVTGFNELGHRMRQEESARPRRATPPSSMALHARA